jgi:hypothetical protein
VAARSVPFLPATELTVQTAGTVAGKTLLLPLGAPGPTYAHLQDWLTEKRKAKTTVKDISQQVLVKGIKQWAVFEEKRAGATVRTVFKIT